MAYLQINRFEGLNTNTDPRVIKPNKDTDGVAEATEMENVEITKEGALTTSNGFELVSSITGTGPVLNLHNFEKDDDERYLIITHGTNHYSISPASSVWSTTGLGSYGTQANVVGATSYFGASALNKVILGTDITANTIKKADFVATYADVGGTPPDGYIMTVFMGRLFVANGFTLYYTNVEDEDDWAGGGTIKFNDLITGMKVQGDRMIVFTRTYNQGVIFTYDDSFVLSTPLKEPYERQYGCLAPKSITNVGSDAYYWSDRGIVRLGSENGYDDKGLPRPMSLSKNIEPSLEFTNKKYRARANAAYWMAKQQYWLSVPYGADQFPSRTFVYNETWESWWLRTGFYPSAMAMFRNSDYEPELYFGSYFGPELYKFNDGYSYNGFGYTRKWSSKKFTMGTNIMFKEFRQIDITGSMDAATEIYVTIEVDSQKKTYKIDNTFLIRDAYSNYIGDDWIGDAYLGGDAPSETRFKRFYAPLNIPRDLREGLEMTITIQNDGEEQPWKIDFIGIEYEMRAKKQVLRRNYVNQQVTI